MSEITTPETGTGEDDGKNYATYNGMGREALAWGIPVVPFAFSLLYLLISGFGGMLFFGPTGALFGLTGIALLLYLRGICETDSRAIRLRVLMFRRLLLSINAGSRTILLTPLTHRRRYRSIERFLSVQSHNQKLLANSRIQAQPRNSK